MTDTAETSPQLYARIGGVLYLIIIVISFRSEFFVRDKLVVSGDVTAAANNIVASESLWRISIAGGFGLAELPLSAARTPAVPLRCRLCPARGFSADPVAARLWRRRTTIEGAGQRSGGTVIAARHPHLIQALA
jgi:hypothetical protein